MREAKKRALSLLMSLVLLLTLLPTGLFTLKASATTGINYDSQPGNFTYQAMPATSGAYSSDDYLIVNGYAGSSTAIQFPETVTVSSAAGLSAAQKAGYAEANVTTLPVKAVGGKAFASSIGAKEIKYVRLSANIEEIRSDSFYHNQTLLEVDIPSGSHLKTISYNAFGSSYWQYPNEVNPLRRIGVEGSYQMPASLTEIDQYAFCATKSLTQIDFSLCTNLTSINEAAFTASGLTSVVLPPNLTNLGWSAFSNCKSLTDITVPSTVTYVGPYCFENSELASLTFNCRISSLSSWGGWGALRGLPATAKIYVPQPVSAEEYTSTVSELYGHMMLNGGAELYWVGNTAHQQKPTMNASGAVTISGNDASGNAVSLTDLNGNLINYDYNDSDRDGLGGVVYLTGRQTEGSLQLTINSGSCGNAGLVTWGRSEAYNDRAGTDDVGYDVLRGTALTAKMRRLESLGVPTSSAASVSLRLSYDDSLGVYYYFPKLIDQGGVSSPQSSYVGPPIAVVYRPTEGTGNQVTASMSGGSGVNDLRRYTGKPDAEYTCRPTAGVEIVANGFETLFGLNDAFVQGTTQASVGGNAITYQWYKAASASTTGGTEVSQANGGSGTAVYAGYDRVTGKGLLWKVGGVTPAYIASLSTGSHYFYLVVTVTAGGVQTTLKSGVMQVNLYEGAKITGFTFDASEAGSGNFTQNAGTNANPHFIKQNTANVAVAPVTNDDAVDTGFVYDWAYNSGTSHTELSSHDKYLPLDSASIPELGSSEGAGKTIIISCSVRVNNAAGQYLTRDTANFSLTISTDAASYTVKMPKFYDDSNTGIGQSNRQDLTMNGGKRSIVACMSSDLNTDLRPMSYEVYEAKNAVSNRGGAKIFGPGTTAVSSPFVSTGTYSNGNSFGYYAVAIDLDAPSEGGTSFAGFSNYGPHYVYLKAKNSETGETAYSPVFVVLPDGDYVANRTDYSSLSALVTAQPASEAWTQSYGSAITTTVSAAAELKNLPVSNKTLVWQAYNRTAGTWDDILFNSSDYTAQIGTKTTDALTTQVACTADSETISGNTLDSSGTAQLTIADNDALTSLFDLSDYASDGAVQVRLKICGAFYDLADNSTAFHAVYSSVSTLKKSSFAFNALPTVTGTGGKRVWAWDGTEYQYIDATTDDMASAERWLFSERYDGRNSGDSYNQPASEAPVTFTATTSVADTVIVWKISNGAHPDVAQYNGELNQSSASMLLEQGDAYNGYAAYATSMTATWSDGGMTSTLTIPVPTGADSAKLTVTPMAVHAANGVRDGGVSGDAQTVLLNPIQCATKPYASVYGSSSDLYFHPDQTTNFPYTIQARFSVRDNEKVTYQWFRSADTACDPIADTAVSGKTTVTGSQTAAYTLTQDDLTAIGSGGSAYYLLNMSVYNADATVFKTMLNDSKIARVSVGDYRVLAAPVITQEYAGTHGGTYEEAYISGDAIPDGFLTLKTSKPAANVNQAVTINYAAVDLDTGKPFESGSRAVGRAEWSGGTLTAERGGGEGFTSATLSDDAVTYSFTPDYAGLDSSSSSYPYAQIIFQWSVQETDTDNTAQYAWGGNTATTLSTYTYTLTQNRATKPTVGAVSLDAAATADNITTGIPTDAGFSSETLTSVPSFTQYQWNYRPFRFPLTAAAGDGVTAGVEYWDTAAKAWKTMDNTYSVAADGSSNRNTTYATGDTATLEVGDAYNSDTSQYAVNNGEAVLYLRVRATAEHANNIYGVSLPGYSGVFALRRAASKSDAAQPIIGTGSWTDSYVWNSADASLTTMTIHGGTWSVSDGGTLSYQWKYRNASNTFVNVPADSAASRDLTLTAAQVQALLANSYHKTSQYVELYLAVTNTNNSSAVTGNRTSGNGANADLYYLPTAFAPAAAASASDASVVVGTTKNTASDNGSLTASVSNPTQMRTLSYCWEYRVTNVTPAGKAAVATGDTEWMTVYAGQWGTYTNAMSGEEAAYPLPLLGGKFHFFFKNPDTGVSGYNTYAAGSLWTDYDAITVEYRCRVTNTDTDKSADHQTAESYTNTATVTFAAPSFNTAVTAAYSDGSASAAPMTITAARNVVLSVPERVSTSSYQWYASSDNGLAASDDGRMLTLTPSNYNSTYPYYFCVITDTATGISRGSARTLVNYVDATAAAKPVFGTGEDYTADVNDAVGAAASFNGSAISTDGGTISYRWYRYNGSGWTALADKTAATLPLADFDNAPGVYRFRCTATNTRDGMTAQNSVQRTLTVRGIVINLSTPLPDAATGVPYSTGFTVDFYGFTGSGTNVTVSSGGTLQPGTASYTLSGKNAETISETLTGTLATGDSDMVIVTAENYSAWSYTAGANVSKDYTVSLPYTVESKSFIVQDGVYQGALGTAYSAAGPLGSFATQGTPGGTVAWSWTGDIPEGLTLTTDGKIVGTPTAPGAYAVTVSATANGTTATREASVVVASPAAGKAGSLTVGSDTYSDVATADYAGPGWSWSHAAGTLTLNGYAGGRIYYYSNAEDNPGLSLRVRANSTVTAEGMDTALYSSGSGSGSIDLYGAGDLTLRSAARGAYSEGTLTDHRAAARTLTVTVSGDTSSNNYGITANTVTGCNLSVTVEAPTDVSRTYGVYGSLTVRGGTTSIDVSPADQNAGRSLFGVYGSLTLTGGSVTVNTHATGAQSSLYAVYGVLAVSGGTAQIIATDTPDATGTADSVFGVADNNGTGSAVSGGTVTVTASNGTKSGTCNGMNGAVTHSGGTLTVSAEGSYATGIVTALSATGSGSADVSAAGASRAIAVGRLSTGAGSTANVTLSARANGAGLAAETAWSAYGAYYTAATLGSGTVTITADAADAENQPGENSSAIGVDNTLTTGGTGNVTVTAKGGGSTCRAANKAAIGHTAGTASLTTENCGTVDSHHCACEFFSYAEGKSAGNYTVTGGYNQASASYTAAAAGAAPAVTGSASASTYPGKTVSLAYTATSAHAVTWSVQGTLPGWLTAAADGYTYTLSGTAPNLFCSYAFTVRATDAADSASYTNYPVTLTVNPTAVANTAYSGADFTGDTALTVSSGALPDGMTITAGGDLSGTPTWPGKYSFTLKNGENVVGTFTMLVTAAETLSTGQNFSYTANDGTNVNFSSVPEGDHYSYDAETGVLTLKDGFTASYLRCDMPLYIVLNGDAQVVNGSNTAVRLGSGLYLRADSAHTLTAKTTYGTALSIAQSGGAAALYVGANATLSCTADTTSAAYALFSRGAVTISGDGTVLLSASGSRAYGYYDNDNSDNLLIVTGGATVTVTAQGGSSTTYGIAGALLAQGSGNVTVTAQGTGSSVAGVTKRFTVSGSGNVTVTAIGTEDGTKTGTPAATNVIGVVSEPIAISGTGDVTVESYGGTGKCVAVDSGGTVNIAHTAGTASFRSGNYGTAASHWGLGAATVTENNYIITGSLNSNAVSYQAVPAGSKPVVTVPGSVGGTGTEADPYVVNAVKGQNLSVTLRAASADTVTWTWTDPSIGLTFASNGYTATLTDAPTGAATFPVTATNAKGATTIYLNIKAAATVLSLPTNSAAISEGTLLVAMGTAGSSFTIQHTGTAPESYTFTVTGNVTAAAAGGQITVAPGTSAAAGDTATIVIHAWSGTTPGTGEELASLTVPVKIVSNGPSQLIVDGASVANPQTANASGTGWSWDFASMTLTLTNYNGGYIFAKGPLTVVYSGNCTVTAGSSQECIEARNGLLTADLTVRASDANAKLTLSGGENTLYTYYGGKLTVEGGTIDARGSIWTQGSVTVKNVKKLSVRIMRSGKTCVGLSGPTITMDGNYYVAGTYNSASYFAIGTTIAPDVLVPDPGTGTAGTALTVTPKVTAATVYSSAGTTQGALTQTQTYQWQQKTGEAWADVSDATGASYTPPAEGTYRCSVTNAASHTGMTLTSTAAAETFTVSPAGYTVSGGSGTYGDTDYEPGVAAHSTNTAWLAGDTTVTLKDKTDDTNTDHVNTTNNGTVNNASQEDYEFALVQDGTYTMTVEKNHFAPVETEVTVSGGNVEVPTVDLYQWGDVSLDGEHSSTDTLIEKRIVAGIVTPNKDQKNVADINGDGEFTSTDTLMTKRIVAGVLTK